MSTGERRVWLAVVYPIGLADIFGAAWEIVDDRVLIGRSATHAVVLRSVLLPLGNPPALRKGG